MPTNQRLFKKTPQHTRTEKSGTTISPGPYEAVVKEIDDPTRSGRLKVWIPELGGGDQEEPKNWRSVSYASPFAGKTYLPPDKAGTANSFRNAEHTYGFWAVPPDRGNIVLVTFINGDPDRGYWFACVVDKLGHHMIPAIGGKPRGEFDEANIDDPDIKAAITDQSILPVSEFNEAGGMNVDSNFVNKPVPIHEYQAKTYIRQGLDTDAVRGARDMGSQRETPSSIYGWSTPGRPLRNDPQEKTAELQAAILDGTINAAEWLDALGRKGGHTFVMDDGAFFGGGRAMRFRSSEGHQILMDDDNRVMHIINSEGSVWIELADSGHLSIFAARGVNIRAGDNINLHSDKSININAAEEINMRAGTTFNINSKDTQMVSDASTTLYGASIAVGAGGGISLHATGAGSFKSDGELNLKGSKVLLNTGEGPSVDKPNLIVSYSQADVAKENGRWVNKADILNTICNFAPTHEPWERSTGVDTRRVATQTAPSSGSGSTAGGGSANPGNTQGGPSSNGGTNSPGSTGTSGSNSKGKLTDPPAPGGAIGISADCANVGSADPGPASAGTPPKNRVPAKSAMADAASYDPPTGMGPLTRLQWKAYLLTVGKSESGNNYKCVNSLNFCGKYQFGAAALASSGIGHIRAEYIRKYGQSDRNGELGTVKHPEAWTGKGGINNLDDWLNSPAAQEAAMQVYTLSNYNALRNNQGIKEGDDLCTVMGMLMASHLLGAGGAKKWRFGSGGADAYGTTGGTYFALGKYAADVLASPTGTA